MEKIQLQHFVKGVTGLRDGCKRGELEGQLISLLSLIFLVSENPQNELFQSWLRLLKFSGIVASPHNMPKDHAQNIWKQC